QDNAGFPAAACAHWVISWFEICNPGGVGAPPGMGARSGSGYPPSVRTHYRLARPKRIWGNLPAFGPLASPQLVLFDEERPPFDGDLPAEGIVIAADVAHHQPPAVEGQPP